MGTGVGVGVGAGQVDSLTAHLDSSSSGAVRLGSPAEVTAAIPHFFGFHPDASVVVLGLNRSEDDGRAAISHGLRVDLSSATHGPAAFGRWVAGRMVDTGANETLCVIYPPEGGPARMSDYRRVVAGMCTPLRVAGVAPLDVLFVADGRWWSFLCDRPACCPPEGSPVDAGASAIAPLSAYSGLAVLPNRAALAAGLEPYGADMPERMRAACDAALNRIAAEHAGLHLPAEHAGLHFSADQGGLCPATDSDRPGLHPDAEHGGLCLEPDRATPYLPTAPDRPSPGTALDLVTPVPDRTPDHTFPHPATTSDHPSLHRDATLDHTDPHPDIHHLEFPPAATCCAALPPASETFPLPDTHLKTYDDLDAQRSPSTPTTPLFSDTNAITSDVVITNTRTPIPGPRIPVDSEPNCAGMTDITDITAITDVADVIHTVDGTVSGSTAVERHTQVLDNTQVAIQRSTATRQILDFDWVDVAHAWRLADSLCDGQVPPDRALDDAAAGELLIGLTDVRVRDYLATWCGDDRAGQAVALSVELARRAVTSEQAAAAFSIAAWAAWALGWGAWSRLCLERAGRAVPGYALATLIKQGLERGVGPELVREAARGTARRLHEMRAEHATAIERESARARKAL